MYSEVVKVIKVVISWFGNSNMPIPHQPSPMQLKILSLLIGKFPSWYEKISRTHLLIRNLCLRRGPRIIRNGTNNNIVSCQLVLTLRSKLSCSAWSYSARRKSTPPGGSLPPGGSTWPHPWPLA